MKAVAGLHDEAFDPDLTTANTARKGLKTRATQDIDSATSMLEVLRMTWSGDRRKPAVRLSKEPGRVDVPRRTVLCNAHSQEKKDKPTEIYTGVTGHKRIVHGSLALSSTAANA